MPGWFFFSGYIMNLVDLITFVVLLIVGLMNLEKFQNEVAYVKSQHNDKEYLVRNMEDKEMAADLLAQVSENLKRVVDHLSKKYPKKDSVQRLSDRFNPDSITESSAAGKYTSYTVNKGEKIVFVFVNVTKPIV